MKNQENYFLGCTDCRKKFDTLKKLNQHISATGHRDSKTIDKYQILISVGIFKKLDNYSVNLQTPLLSI